MINQHDKTIVFEPLIMPSAIKKENLAYRLGLHLNPFPNKPWFLHVCSTGLLKILWEKVCAPDKQFFLFQQCFLPVWRTFCHFN